MEGEPIKVDINPEAKKIKPEVIIDKQRGEAVVLIDEADPDIDPKKCTMRMISSSEVNITLSNGKEFAVYIDQPVDLKAIEVQMFEKRFHFIENNGQIELVLPLKGVRASDPKMSPGLEIDRIQLKDKPDVIEDRKAGEVSISLDLNKYNRAKDMLNVFLDPLGTLVEIRFADGYNIYIDSPEIDKDKFNESVRDFKKLYTVVNGHLNIRLPLKKVPIGEKLKGIFKREEK